MTDAELLKAMYALLNESADGVSSEWAGRAFEVCRDYRMSRPDTRTGLGATPTVAIERDWSDGECAAANAIDRKDD